MGQKEVSALIITCGVIAILTIFLIALALEIGSLHINIDSVNEENSSLATQIFTLQSELDVLNNETVRLGWENLHLRQQLNDLSDYKDELRAAYFVGSLDVEITYSATDNSSIRVFGYLCNVGTNPALGSELFVDGYQDETIIVSGIIELGSLEGRTMTYLNSTISFANGEITYCHVWSEPSGIDLGIAYISLG